MSQQKYSLNFIKRKMYKKFLRLKVIFMIVANAVSYEPQLKGLLKIYQILSVTQWNFPTVNTLMKVFVSQFLWSGTNWIGIIVTLQSALFHWLSTLDHSLKLAAQLSMITGKTSNSWLYLSQRVVYIYYYEKSRQIIGSKATKDWSDIFSRIRLHCFAWTAVYWAGLNLLSGGFLWLQDPRSCKNWWVVI